MFLWMPVISCIFVYFHAQMKVFWSHKTGATLCKHTLQPCNMPTSNRSTTVKLCVLWCKNQLYYTKPIVTINGRSIYKYLWKKINFTIQFDNQKLIKCSPMMSNLLANKEMSVIKRFCYNNFNWKYNLGNSSKIYLCLAPKVHQYKNVILSTWNPDQVANAHQPSTLTFQLPATKVWDILPKIWFDKSMPKYIMCPSIQPIIYRTNVLHGS